MAPSVDAATVTFWNASKIRRSPKCTGMTGIQINATASALPAMTPLRNGAPAVAEYEVTEDYRPNPVFVRALKACISSTLLNGMPRVDLRQLSKRKQLWSYPLLALLPDDQRNR